MENQEEHKTQLSLEFLHKRSYHVLDALFVETWKGVEFKKVVQYLPPRKYNPDDPFVCGIADFVSAMQDGLFFLAIEKNFLVLPSFLFVLHVSGTCPTLTLHYSSNKN